MRHATLVGAVSVVVVMTAACGGSGSGGSRTTPPAEEKPATPPLETRWLRGLWANDIREAVGPVGLTCKGPQLENRLSVWTCGSGTPLVTYQVRYYGSAPGKIEYINAVVTQTGSAKDELPLRVFGVLAGLHFSGADPVKARQWLQASFAGGGSTVIGPAKYKLAGDAGRRTFDIKASGSDW